MESFILEPHTARCYWLTGLPAAGKTTLARHFQQALDAMGIDTMVLDGDALREGLNADLGYGPKDRAENVRRIGEVAKLLVDAGIVAIVSAVSPYLEDRQKVRSRFEAGRFIEVFVDTDVQTCMARDPKGLYRKAREGQIPNLTGFNAPYERSEKPDITVCTPRQSPKESAARLVDDHLSYVAMTIGHQTKQAAP